MSRKPSRKVTNTTLHDIVQMVGGTSHAAIIMGVSSQRVSNWMYADINMPPEYGKILLDFVNNHDIYEETFIRNYSMIESICKSLQPKFIETRGRKSVRPKN